MTTPSVCIVDDAADYRLLLQHLFNHHFPVHSVAFFADGSEFLAKLTQLSELPSLILLDRHMPHLDGHQTLLHLKDHSTYKKIPVVMMSAEATALEINDCYAAGVNSFLRKSMDFDSMENQINIICQYWLEMNLKPA